MADEEQKLKDLYVDPAGEITEDLVTLDSETDSYQFEARAAVKLVVDDAERADNFLNVLQWASGWTLSDIIYQSPQATSAFDGGNVAQANVPKFTLSNHVSAIVPKVVGGLFYDDPPFLLRPRPGTSQEVVRTKTALFAYQLDEMKFEEEVERTVMQMALMGTGIMKWGYSEYTDKIKKRVRKGDKLRIETPAGIKSYDSPESDEFEVQLQDHLISRPWIKYCDIRTVLVDPGCRYGDIRRSNWVIYRDFATYDDLNRLRDVEGYKIPDESVLKTIFFKEIGGSSGVDNITMTIPEAMWGYLQHAVPRSFKTSADPLKAPMELMERWDNDKVIVVLSCNGHNILIRNESNPYSKIPFYSANWRDIQDCFYGQGLGILVGSEQLVEQGVTNLALDLLAYGLQPTALRKKGFNTLTQALRWKQGGIIDVDDDVDKAFKFLQMPPVPSEAWAFIQQAQSSAASNSGSNELVGQGGTLPGAHATGMRSGTGAAAVVSAQASRLDGPTNRFVRQVFEPWLEQMDELNNDLLPTSVLKQLLGDELGEAFEKNKFDHIEFRNASLEFEVLAGAKLGAKREMAQAIPFMLQLMNNPTYTANLTDHGYTWDGVALFKLFSDISGLKFSQDVLRQMTPEEKQKHDANSPAALQQKQLQAQQQQGLQKFQQQQQLEDQQQLGKAANEVLRQTTEKALTPLEVTGEAGGDTGGGFGTETGL